MNKPICILSIIIGILISSVSANECNLQSKFDNAITIIVSDYINEKIEPFNILITMESETQEFWIGKVEIYKYGYIKIVIDNTNREIIIIDGDESIIIFKEDNENIYIGNEMTKMWITEYYK